MKGTPINLVIFTIDLPEANAITYRLVREFHPHIKGLIRSRTLRQGHSSGDAVKYVYRQSGPLLIAKALETALCPVASLLPGISGKTSRTAPLRRIARQYGLELRATSDINTTFLRNLISDWEPDLLVSIYINQRFDKDLLSLGKIGAINVHPSLLPTHRGLLPYIWAMSEGDQETGVTVHWMDEDFDTGEIIQQRSTPIHQGESSVSLAHRCADMAAEMLTNVIRDLQRGHATRVPRQPGKGSYHSWPDRDCLRNCRRQGHGYLAMVDMLRELSRAA